MKEPLTAALFAQRKCACSRFFRFAEEPQSEEILPTPQKLLLLIFHYEWCDITYPANSSVKKSLFDPEYSPSARNPGARSGDAGVNITFLL